MIKVIVYKPFNQTDAELNYAIVTPFGIKGFGAVKDVAIVAANRGASLHSRLSGSYTLREFCKVHGVVHSFFVEHK